MSRETLLEELDRLLDVGGSLLDVFPCLSAEDWLPQLPDNISSEMRWYAYNAAWRRWANGDYQKHLQNYTVPYLTKVVGRHKSGLLGWRAVGVLR